MMFFDTEATLLLIGILLLTTILAGTLSRRFRLPALIDFLCLEMLARAGRLRSGVAGRDHCVDRCSRCIFHLAFERGWICMVTCRL